MQLHVDHSSYSHLYANLAIQLAGAVMGHFGLPTITPCHLRHLLLEAKFKIQLVW